MSGPGCATYRIIQYALVAADASGRECGTLSSMMQNDGPAITEHAYNVHHIDSTMLESHGAPSQLDGMRQLVDFLEEQGRHGPTVLVAHNGFACDFKYLHHTLKRLGLRLPATVAHFVDSLRLARGVEWATRPPNFKLGTLYSVATGAALAGAHDALADTRALARMFMGLPCLWTARQSQVHAWSKFAELEDVRQAAKEAALAQPSRNPLEDSDTDSALSSDSEAGDGDANAGQDEAKEAGEWTSVADGDGMDRAPEDLFARGGATRGLKHAARIHFLSPSGIFLKLLEPVASLLVEETNRYAAQKRAASRIHHFLEWCVERRQRPFADIPFERHGMRRWDKVTRAEMRGFLAAVLRCSVHSTLGQAYSDTAECMRVAPAEYARLLIGRQRCEQIKRYLHASDSARQPASGSANYDPAYKVARLLQTAVKSWNKHYDPGPVVSIDETLLNFKGRYRHRVTIRSKRHKTGIKLYVATGVRPNYVVAVRVKCAGHDRSSGCFEGTKVVLQLMEDAQLLDQYRTVVTDNWYTSIEALKALKARSTFCYGVLRATRVPAAARFTEAEQRQHRGFSKTVYNSTLDAMVVGWMDNKLLYCLSNATSSKCDHEVRRRVKGVGSTTVKAPDTLRRYNWDMGGVDWVDAITANLSFGTSMGRTRKWWKKVLWYIIDTMTTNANVLFNQFGLHRPRSPDAAPFKRLSRREFVLQVLDEMYSEALARVQQSPPERSIVRSHLPELHPRRARCWVCQASEASRLTKWKCAHPACPADLRLCHPQRSWGKRDCFQVFHRNPGRFKAKRSAPAAFASPQSRSARR